MIFFIYTNIHLNKFRLLFAVFGWFFAFFSCTLIIFCFDPAFASCEGIDENLKLHSVLWDSIQQIRSGFDTTFDILMDEKEYPFDENYWARRGSFLNDVFADYLNSHLEKIFDAVNSSSLPEEEKLLKLKELQRSLITSFFIIGSQYDFFHGFLNLHIPHLESWTLVYDNVTGFFYVKL